MQIVFLYGLLVLPLFSKLCFTQFDWLSPSRCARVLGFWWWVPAAPVQVGAELSDNRAEGGDSLTLENRPHSKKKKFGWRNPKGGGGLGPAGSAFAS